MFHSLQMCFLFIPVLFIYFIYLFFFLLKGEMPNSFLMYMNSEGL
jgi:hypothetical protein